jgi:tripeptidyl-peptidase-1
MLVLMAMTALRALVLITMTCLLTPSFAVSAAYKLKETGKMDAFNRPDFTRKNRATSSDRHQVIIAVQQNNLDKVNDLLYEVSTMSSPKYGQFLSFEEIGDLVKNEEATEAVISWLRSNNVNIVDRSIHGEYITADATVAVWESLLKTEMHEYEPVRFSYEDTMKKVVRGLSYSIPEYLDKHIFAIHEFTHLPPQLTHHSRVKTLPKVDKDGKNQFRSLQTTQATVTATNLRSIYQITGLGNTLSTQGVYESSGQTFLASDLSIFQSQFGLVAHPVDTIIGALPSGSTCNVNPDNCGEASLDIQYLLAVAQVPPITYYYDSSASGDFVSFITALANSANPSMVYSISYGAYEVQVPSSSITTFNTEAQKLGLRGVTITVSSGDDGVTGIVFLVFLIEF